MISPVQTFPLKATVRMHLGPESLASCAELICGGGLVAFPTETVYGLGANAGDREAVDALYAAKGRPAINPLIVHLADPEEAEQLAVFDALSRKLAAIFWPGPLTLILPVKRHSGIAEAVLAGGSTLGIRVPSRDLTRDLIRLAGVPVAAPSANLSGQVSPTTAEHVISDLNGRIDAVLDAGECPLGLESTVIRPVRKKTADPALGRPANRTNSA